MKHTVPWSSEIFAVCVCLVTRSCLTLCMNCSPPGFSVHGDSLDKDTGVDCHVLLQGIFPTQGSTPGPHCRWIFYWLCHQGRWKVLAWVGYPFYFSAQESNQGLSGELLRSGIKPGSPALQAISLPAELPGKPIFTPGVKR